jgi:6-phosphogluconolactonase
MKVVTIRPGRLWHALGIDRPGPEQMGLSFVASRPRATFAGGARGSPRARFWSLSVLLLVSGCSGRHGCLLCGPFGYGVNGTVDGLVGSGLVLQTNGFTTPVRHGANGSYQFAFLQPGTAYDVTVAAQPSNPLQTCVVTNGSGTIGSADVSTVAVTCTTRPGRFLYSANRGSNDITAYAIDAQSGSLTALPGSPFRSGSLPDSLAIDRSSSFVYAANQGDDTVSAFAIDAASGALTAVSGPPFTTGSRPLFVAADPSGKFVYVTNGNSGAVSGYVIDPASGGLRPIAGSPFAAGVTPDSMSIETLGGPVFAYVGNDADGTISGFAIDATTGALTPIAGSPYAAGPGALSLVATSFSTSFSILGLFAANAGSNTISVWLLDSQGHPSAVSGSPFTAGTAPRALAVDPLSKFAYVANQSSNDISAYAINSSDGALTAVNGSPFAAGTAPVSVAIDPTGKFAYVANSASDNITVYGIDATTGRLTPVKGSPFAAGSLPSAIAVSQ